ncbi:MAG TPA: gamma-glutamylcyclotransferase family protein [Candidatus Cybelea sp.]|nr:gamma-glutamylcyclotransferase family protein [Candidatus Cybelea sp.]
MSRAELTTAAMRIFVYGTLLDPDVLRAVLGRRVPAAQRSKATLAGVRRVRAVGHRYPILVRARGQAVSGMVLDGLDAADAARLRHYENDGYALVRRRVELGDGSMISAHVFVPVRRLAGTNEDWNLATWQGRGKRTALAAIRAHMRAFRLQNRSTRKS